MSSVTNEFSSTVTKQTFKIKTHLNCSSNFIINLLECPCKLQYVGRTMMTQRNRMNKHRHNVSKGFINTACLVMH